MNDKPRQGASRADIVGPLLFTLSSIVGVSVLIALWKGTPAEGARGIGAVARSVVLAVGHTPALIAAAGGAYLGARVFLRGDFQGLGRDLSGVAGACAGLAILLGALSETAGGSLGAATGGLLSRYLTTVVGAPVGLAAFLAPIWLTWIRDSAWLGGGSAREDALSLARGHGIGSSPEASEDDDGSAVTAAEAQALLPDAEEPPLPELRKPRVEEILTAEVPDWALKNESTNPYPDDPRRVGEIPSGTRPLASSDAAQRSTATEVEPADGGDEGFEAGGGTAGESDPRRWTPGAGSAAVDAPDEDLAGAAACDAGEPEPALGASAVRDGLSADGGSEPAAPHASLTATPPAEPEVEPVAAPERASSNDSGARVVPVERVAPRPSWEVAEAQKEQEEKVVEPEASATDSLWKPGSKTAEDVDVAAATEVEPASALPTEAAKPAQEEEPSVAELEVIEELEDEEVEPEELDEEELEAEEAEDEEFEEEEPEDDEEWEAAEDEEDAEAVEEEEDDEEYEYVELAEGEEPEEDEEGVEYVYVEVDEDGEAVEEGDEDDEEYEYEYVEVDEDGNEIEEEGEDDEVEEPELAAELDEDEESEEPQAVTAEASKEEQEAEDTEPVQMDLFDDPAEEPAAATAAGASVAEGGGDAEGSDEEGAEEEGSEEPVVVLQPQASPASANALRAADVILSESRVAVSLLQRNIGLDFKDSCAVLDELQELGFIGPYVEGKPRDILMDREEWLCAVGSE